MGFIAERAPEPIRNQYLARQFDLLLDVLCEIKTGLFSVKETVRETDVRQILSLLLADLSQYTQEISSKLNILTHTICSEKETKTGTLEKMGLPGVGQNPEVLLICNKTECLLVKAYRFILNDPALYPDMRHMLQHQLNRLMGSFLSIKLFYACLKPGCEE